MKKYLITLIAVSMLISCSQQSANNADTIYDLKKVNEGPTVVTVNGTDVHQGLLDVLSTLNARIKAQLANPLTRKKIVESLVDQQLLYQEAMKRGLANEESVIIKSLLNKHVIVSNALLERETESAMKKAYDERVDTEFTKLNVSLIAAYFQPKESKKNKKKEIKATDAEIKAALARIKKIKARLTKGDDFVAVAKEESDDKMTAKKGGKAGKVSKNDKRFKSLGYEPLITAAFKMKKDEVSGPIKTKNGYYLVKVTSEPFVISFEDAKRVLGFELQNKVKENLLKELKGKAKIEYALIAKPAVKKEEKKVVPTVKKEEEKTEPAKEKKDTVKKPVEKVKRDAHIDNKPKRDAHVEKEKRDAAK